MTDKLSFSYRSFIPQHSYLPVSAFILESWVRFKTRLEKFSESCFHHIITLLIWLIWLYLIIFGSDLFFSSLTFTLSVQIGKFHWIDFLYSLLKLDWSSMIVLKQFMTDHERLDLLVKVKLMNIIFSWPNKHDERVIIGIWNKTLVEGIIKSW